MIARAAALLSGFALCLGLGMSAAAACTCDQAPSSAKGASGAERQKNWQFDRATRVARGLIVSVRAGEEARRDGKPVVLATMRVHTVLKGDLPTGEVTVVTSASSASCGMGEHLLRQAQAGQDMSLELFPGKAAGEFAANLCSYFLLGPEPNRPQTTR